MRLTAWARGGWGVTPAPKLWQWYDQEPMEPLRGERGNEDRTASDRSRPRPVAAVPEEISAKECERIGTLFIVGWSGGSPWTGAVAECYRLCLFSLPLTPFHPTWQYPNARRMEILGPRPSTRPRCHNARYEKSEDVLHWPKTKSCLFHTRLVIPGSTPDPRYNNVESASWRPDGLNPGVLRCVLGTR